MYLRIISRISIIAEKLTKYKSVELTKVYNIFIYSGNER